MDDQILFDRIKKGDEVAFEKLFRKYYENLRRFIWGYVKSEAVAEELIQEVFLKIWKNREHLKINRSVSAYLFRSARNMSIDYVRHANVEQSWADEKQALDQLNDRPSIDKQLNDKLILDEVKKAIQALPERRREIFILSRYEGLSYKEIADLLDISVSTVETQISRSLKKLRDLFEPYITFVSFLLFFFIIL